MAARHKPRAGRADISPTPACGDEDNSRMEHAVDHDIEYVEIWRRHRHDSIRAYAPVVGGIPVETNSNVVLRTSAILPLALLLHTGSGHLIVPLSMQSHVPQAPHTPPYPLHVWGNSNVQPLIPPYGVLIPIFHISLQVGSDYAEPPRSTIVRQTIDPRAAAVVPSQTQNIMHQ